HRAWRTWPTRTAWPIRRRAARHGRRKLGLHLAATPAASRTTATATSWAAPLTAKLVTTVFAARCSTPVAVKLAIGIQIVGFEVPIDCFTTGACGATPGCGLDHHQWGFVLLGYLRWREPGLLQRGILAEQRFLQRPSHTLSLQTLKILAPPVGPVNATARLR